MAKVLITQKYPPMIDPTRTTLAYGAGALPRLNRELNDKDSLLTRQRALRSFCDYLRDPEHIASSLDEGMIFTLLRLMKDKDDFVRQKTTECFYIFSCHAIGRQAILDNKVIDHLFRMYEDPDELVRRNMYTTLTSVAEFPIGAQGVYDAGLVTELVEKVKTETPDIQVLILNILYDCMLIDTQLCLDVDSMRIFTDLLLNEWAPIRARAAKAVMALSVTLQGKNKAVEEKCMDSLVANLTDDSEDVRCYSAGAIMVIAITTKGKYTAIGADALLPLVELVDDPCSEVRMNSLKALTCLSEAPEGREQLLKPLTLKKIKVHLHDPIPGVAEAARIAVNTITWKP